MQGDCNSDGDGILDCSSQMLYQMPDISKYDNVTEANFRNNFIVEIPSKAFDSVAETLEILDLSHNNISFLDENCFHGLTKLKILKLGHNRLCLHSAYREGIFKDLTNLKVLYTFGNKCFDDSPAQRNLDTYKDLSYLSDWAPLLKDLTNHSDVAPEIMDIYPPAHNNYPDASFKDLISLERISLDIAANFTLGNRFKSLRKLASIEISGYDTSVRPVIISNHSFSSLAGIPITSLTLRGYSYGSIDSGALQHFEKLKIVNIACTQGLRSILKSMHNMPRLSLETLILDGVRLYDPVQDSKTPSISSDAKQNQLGKQYGLFCHPKFNNVKRLSIRLTGLTGITLKREVETCLPSLEQLNIGGNDFVPPINFINRIGPLFQDLHPVLLQQGFPEHLFHLTRRIRTLDASHRPDLIVYMNDMFCKPTELEVEDYFSQDQQTGSEEQLPGPAIYAIPQKFKDSHDLTTSTIVQFPFSPRVTSMEMTQYYCGGRWTKELLSCPWILFPFDSLVSLNLSYNDAKGLPCEILGLTKLRIFDCTGCNLDSMSPNLTKREYLPNVEKLLLSNNRLGALAKSDQKFLHEMTNLKELVISNNEIEELAFDLFKNLNKLEKLDLSGNILSAHKDLGLQVSRFRQLTFLDLS